MSWKTDLHLADLQPATRIEVTCRKCQASRYVVAGDLMQQDHFAQLRLSEVERDLTCRTRHCNGKLRLALGHNHINEGFAGGMA